MSDDSLSFDEGAAGAAPAEATAPETGQGETEAAPSHEYLDVDQYGGHHVRLKVDGEEHEVPLSEALSGYSRQADYTRKTQELADLQRQAQFGLTLQQALENNPAETLRILQSQFDAEEQPEQQPDWTDDPTETKFRALDQRLGRWEQQQADSELRQALGVLQGRYGDDFNPVDVVQRAAAMGRMDLEGVYKEMAFERYWQGQQAAKEELAQQEAGRIDAKTQASELVHQGGSANNTVSPDADSYSSIEDAWFAAKRSLGIS